MPKLNLHKMKTESMSSLAIKSNSKRSYTFVPGVNSVTGRDGWKPKEIPGFDPVDPVMIVHDILEHFPGDEDGPHNEYQAQGAMFWLRHEGGFFADKGLETSRAVIVPAFGMLFHHILRKGLITKPCPQVTEAHKELTFKTELEMQQTMLNARSYVFGTQTFNGPGVSFPSTVGQEKGKVILTKSIEQALGWMRIGYRRAAIRYKGKDKKKLVRLYKKIVEAIDNTDSGTDEIQLSINVSNYSAELWAVQDISA